MDPLLTNLYYNQHLTSIQALYPEAIRTKPADLQFTRKDVVKWMSQQTAQQQTKRQEIHEDLPVTTDNRGSWALDLTILTQFAKVGFARRRPPPNAVAVQLPNQQQQPILNGIQLQPQPIEKDTEGEEEEDVGARLRPVDAPALPARNRRPPRRNADEGYGSGITMGGRLLQINGRNYNLNDRYINGDMSILFTVIHIPTRYVYIYPMKTKSSDESAQCASYWMEDATRDGFQITEISSDLGREFEGAFAAWVRLNNIQHIKVVGGGPGVSIINSLHSHLKRWILKEMLIRGSVRWIDLIEPFLTMYNTKRKHSSLRLKDANNKWVYYTPLEFKNSQLLQDRLHSDKRTETAAILANEHRWAVGDMMRIQFVNRGYIKKTTVPVYSRKTYPVLALRGFQLQYPGENAGDPPRWIARKHAMHVPNPTNSHTNTATDDSRFHRLVADNRRQRAYDQQMRLLQGP